MGLLLIVQTDIVGYSILPVVRQLSEMCGEAGKFVHVGFNTQDIHDLAVSLQIKAGLDLIEDQLNTARATLVRLAKEHKNTIMMGREWRIRSVSYTICVLYMA